MRCYGVVVQVVNLHKYLFSPLLTWVQFHVSWHFKYFLFHASTWGSWTLRDPKIALQCQKVVDVTRKKNYLWHKMMFFLRHFFLGKFCKHSSLLSSLFNHPLVALNSCPHWSHNLRWKVTTRNHFFLKTCWNEKCHLTPLDHICITMCAKKVSQNLIKSSLTCHCADSS